VSFKGLEDSPKIQEFYDKMQEFDNTLIDSGVKNSKDWLGKVMKTDVVDALYRPLVKPSKDPEKYAPTIKFKIPSKDGKLIVTAYDHDKQPFDVENLLPGTKVQALIECSSIWFVNKQFGVSWKLVQLFVSKPEKLAGFSFVNDDDDMEDESDEDIAPDDLGCQMIKDDSDVETGDGMNEVE